MNSFSYQDSKLFCEQVSVEDICKKVDTPFYLYSSNTIVEKYNSLASNLKNSNVLIAYAVKASSNIAILRLLAKKGAGADVVSYGELIRALKAGIPANKIVYSGVGKKDFEISKAIEEQILQFNVESFEELLSIQKIAKEKNMRANIAIRINPDIEAGGHPKISTGKKTDKFGISEKEALKAYIYAMQLPNIKIVGVDMHIGSQILKIKPFRSSFKKIEKFCTKLESKNIKIKNIDLGGGIGINYTSSKALSIRADYIKLLKEMSFRTKKKIIVEPGRFLSADSGILVTKVLYKKQNEKKNFLIIDAGMNDFIRPALYEASHNVEQVVKRSKNIDKEAYDIVGPICETADVMLEEATFDTVVNVNDYLYIDKVGAYGSAMASTYNSRNLVPEILVYKKKYSFIRRVMTANEFLKLEEIPEWLK